MYRVKLSKLSCEYTEDYTGKDDVQITVSGGNHPEVGTHRFADHDTWNLGSEDQDKWTFEFQNKLVVELLEKDDFDPDDRMGECEITTDRGSHAFHHFRAHYILSWEPA